jgi:putative FmdB family regulatory protein
MPLYEYQCHGCGKKFEVIQKFSDEPLTIHPECGGAAEKLLSAPAFHLKGTGWYATDYAKSNTSSAAKTGEDAAKPATSDSSAATTAESKPAASETKSKSDSTPAPTPSTS